MKQKKNVYQNVLILTHLLCIFPSIGIAESTLRNANFFLQLSSYSYNEPLVMEKESGLSVLGIGVDYTSNHKYPFSAIIAVDFGKTNYLGTGDTRNDPFYIFRGELSKKLYATPLDIYAGLGIRYLYDDWGTGRTSTNHHTYDRSSTYNYAFASFAHNFPSGKALKIKFKKLISGQQEVFISHLPGYQNAKMQQRHGFSIETEWALTDELKLITEYWSVRRSQTDSSGYGIVEPKNSTFQMGIRLSL